MPTSPLLAPIKHFETFKNLNYGSDSRKIGCLTPDVESTLSKKRIVKTLEPINEL